MLEPKQEKILIAVLANPTFVGAAAAAGISVTVLYRVMAEPAFKAAYAAARQDALTQAIGSLQSAAGQATDCLIGVMGASETPPSARISAARSILEYAFKGNDMLDMNERLATLEAVFIKETEGNKS